MLMTGRFTKLLGYSIVAVLVLTGVGPSNGSALSAQIQEHEGHSNLAGPLLTAVRQATTRFQDVQVAQSEGYQPQFGCVTGPDSGAMGMHFLNMPLINDGQIDVTRPEIVIYEPLPNGGLRLIGADYLVFADAWNSTHSEPPQLMGQLFQLFETPNRFGLPAFYSLHVWAWKDSPTGAFVNWNANVSCNAFKGRTTP
jgi:hypothetical protein